MKVGRLLLFGAVLVVFGIAKGLSDGAPLRSAFPIGTVGCLFTRSLCGTEEECVDDLLFGNCQRFDRRKDFFQYQLSKQSLESLEKEIWHLIKGEYSWGDPYTQCVLQNALLAYRREKYFDRSICNTESSSKWSADVNDEVTGILEKIFQDYYDAYKPDQERKNAEEDLDLFNSNKRDEIIHVHKYFDKAPKPEQKRQFPSYLSGQNDLSYLRDYQPLYTDPDPDDLSIEDIRNLQYYLQLLRSQSREPEMEEQWSLDNYQPALQVPSYSESEYQVQIPENKNWVPVTKGWTNNYMQYDDQDKNMLSSWNEAGDYPPGKADDGIVVDGNTDNEQITPLTPDYASLLSKLIAGDIKPESLTDDQIRYLTDYINDGLEQLGYKPEDIDAMISESTHQGLGDEENDDLSKNEDAEKLEASAEKASEMNMVGNDEHPLESEKDKEGEVEVTKKLMGFPVVGDLDLKEKKSGVLENPPEKEDNADPDPGKPVDMNYYYVEVENTMTPELAEELINTLTTKIGPIDDIQMNSHHNKLTFRVDPLLMTEKNASVEDLIDGLKETIKTSLGLTITHVGVGRDNQVEIKHHDDRYFVLSFVLCGCIAGILLAAVVIYLIRRHSQSKEKLAQLSTTTAEGTEPSKDYQDLCRQRMQSKASEKPEPLHAASRIGSVSEQQVRSPSSRSSTSSWSEEPATSNMDISTGHIVLSYMEDHLKNKDRLDREWEGLCSYEADPSNSSVASDSANMRKNRYSDTLPYDHSRVVLSNTSNASSSDYINASTITDHDPRNPAYIATQGPLPHTVADFWQMVWEQGSVVIVMLTKLTESGEAMCHRYWPEEGSDLYHIYEVHLVSEHVWCDDYLVRSFYLKNLQTNETRTVTQFHFLTWPDLGVPNSIKALLDFRRKVNKSYRGRSCPIAVHCSDGCGRTGTYCLVDMVLNRMAKGAKEIDIAATLEHIRDQRMNMVKTKEQFQFALAAVAEEVHAILKALPQ